MMGTGGLLTSQKTHSLVTGKYITVGGSTNAIS